MSAKRRSLQRLAVGVGAIALVLGGAIGTASAANAAVPTQGTPPGETAEGSTGTLTVHKRSGTTGDAGNGTALASPPGTALGGIDFTAQQVGVWDGATCIAIDLTTAAGWTAAQGAVGATPPAPSATPVDGAFCNSGMPVTQTTAVADGATTFSDLNLGLYYVVEEANGNVAEGAPPFYVTVPFSSVSGTPEAPVTTWLYEVHVYPKNSVIDQPTKTIEDTQADLVIDADVAWTITQKIPTLTGASSTFTEASVNDTLDDRLTYKSSTVTIQDGAGVTVATLEAGTDYTLTGTNTGALVWTLTDGTTPGSNGLATLTANQGNTLVVSLTSTVTGTTAADQTAGSISNEGTVSINQKPRTTPKSYTYWGNLTVNKHDSTVTGAPLADAEFQVFDNAGTATTCPTPVPTTGALATGTSNDDGVVDWTRADQATTVTALGLWIANSNAEIAAPTKNYCLYETKVPAGYTASTSGQIVTISLSDTALNTQHVVNTKVPGPTLPLTGSSGTLMLTIAGIALVGVGGGTVLLRRSLAKRR